MTDIEDLIPPGKAIPLVDQVTKRFPEPTMLEIQGDVTATATTTASSVVKTRATAIGGSLSSSAVPRLTGGGIVANIAGTGRPAVASPAILDTLGIMTAPLARYYIFTSPDHAGTTTSGIDLWTTNDLTQPWTYRQRVLNSNGNQIEFPSVVYNPETDTIHLYAQAYGTLIGSTGQLNFVWTATPGEIEADPTDWTFNATPSHGGGPGNHQADVVAEAHYGYQKGVFLNSTFVTRGLVSGGALGRICTYYSKDGLRFWPDLMPNAGDLDISTPGQRDHLWQIIMWQGQLWGIGARRINQGGGGGIIGVATMGRVRDDLSGWSARPSVLRTVEGDALPNAVLYVTVEGQALFFYSDLNTIRCYEVAA